MSKQKINPRELTLGKNAIGAPPHAMTPLAPKLGMTDHQMRGVNKGGLGHATVAEVPGVNPLDKEALPKPVATQAGNVPNAVGARNRTANRE